MADFTISHHKSEDPHYGKVLNENTHLVMPPYFFTFGFAKIKSIAETIDVNKVLRKKENFCCLVTRRNNVQMRNKIFNEINKGYKKVDSAGRALNNMENNWQVPGWWYDDEIIEFASNYKFMISVEKKEVPGYTSEKVFNALDAKTIPVYWGDPDISDLINPERLIYVNEFDDKREMLAEIKRLDQNGVLYKEKLSKPLIKGGFENHSVYSKKKIINFLKKVFNEN